MTLKGCDDYMKICIYFIFISHISALLEYCQGRNLINFTLLFIITHNHFIHPMNVNTFLTHCFLVNEIFNTHNIFPLLSLFIYIHNFSSSLFFNLAMRSSLWDTREKIIWAFVGCFIIEIFCISSFTTFFFLYLSWICLIFFFF